MCEFWINTCASVLGGISCSSAIQIHTKYRLLHNHTALPKLLKGKILWFSQPDKEKHTSTQRVRYCLSMFTIITQTKTMYNSWMFQAHFISVMSRLLHSVKWSSARHSTQRVFHRVQNLKRTESMEKKQKEPKAHLQWFTWIQSSGTIAQRYSLWNQNQRNFSFFNTTTYFGLRLSF